MLDSSLSLMTFIFILGIFSFGIGSGLAEAGGNKNAEEIKAEAELAKTVAESQTAAYKAEEAKANARKASLSAKYGGIPESGYSGEAKIGSGAGSSEATLLSAVTINQIGKAFADKIIAIVDVPCTLLLYTEGTKPDFQSLEQFNAQYEGFAMLMENLTRPGKQVGTRSLVATGLGLDAVNKLLSFAKTNYEFFDLEVKSDDIMLLNALADHLVIEDNEADPPMVSTRAKNVKVIMPRMYMAGNTITSSEILRKIYTVTDWSKELKALMGEHQAKGELEALTKLSATMDAWVTAQLTVDDKGRSPLDTVIEQQKIRAVIESENTCVVIVKIHDASGTAYTKKNLFSTILWGNPFHVMGGAVASYSMFNGTTGHVVSSMLLPVHGGYYSVSDLKEYIKQHTTQKQYRMKQ